MTDQAVPLPAEAVEAAARVLAHLWNPEADPWPEPDAEDLSQAVAMLAAAADVLRAQGAAAERQRITRPETCSARSPAGCEPPSLPTHPKGAQASFADYLRVTRTTS